MQLRVKIFVGQPVEIESSVNKFLAELKATEVSITGNLQATPIGLPSGSNAIVRPDQSDIQLVNATMMCVIVSYT